MSYDFYLVAREGLPEDLVYTIVKVLWEQNTALTSINSQLQDWIPDHFVTELNRIAYHPGAIRFYKERGVWTQTMESRQQDLLRQGELAGSG